MDDGHIAADDESPDRAERLVRLETRFDMHLAEEARREEESVRRRRDGAKESRRRDALIARERRDLALCVQALIARLDKFEPVILGDEAVGCRSLGERLEALERAVLSARIGWRAASLVGTAILGLLSWLAMFLRWSPPPSSG